MGKRFMGSLVNLIHSALAEKEPKEVVQKFMMIYRSMLHSSTRKGPSELLMNRRIRLKLQGVISAPTEGKKAGGDHMRRMVQREKLVLKSNVLL